MLFFICTAFFGECILVSKDFPKIYNVADYSDISLSSYVPMKINATEKVLPANEICNKNCPIILQGRLTLLDIFPVKTVEMHLVDEKKVTPCGTPFGIKLFTSGPMVINISEVRTEIGASSPAQEAGIKKSDTITYLNGNPITTNEALAEAVEKSEGKTMKVTIMRNNSSLDFNVTPVKSIDDKKYKIGMWVRDSSGGIGTITFYDSKNGTFSGLGHGICDVDTGEILPLEHGEIMDASINGITRGIQGKPGELKGSFVGEKPIGELSANLQTGIYGKIKNISTDIPPKKIAMKQQVKTGPAKILTTISGKKPKYYDINIESINYNENNPTKNILISITDNELLEKSGGIVQGMSGSPIIQNGMLIGAVTHVFINDPKKGYAIFSETMLTKSHEIFNIINKINS